MKHKKTVVCHAVQWALSRQVDEAFAKAELQAELARKDRLQSALIAGLGEADKRYGGGLLKSFRAGLNRLRGRA
ncbi:hypothetical protein [Aeromonas salmonicida]|uniref:hypothetical protein n=1 Tax=Aeromonas salmonicida TaxID=645 RepID=UPI00232F34BA|nr:hypothetical protein [Aeromonas salmonicida]WCH25202.1 hypothetical protein ONZ54_22780 [Aeromonas salmonicida]